MPSPHGNNLRIGRHSITGQIYHVTCCTDDRRPLFSDLSTGRFVVSAIRDRDRHGQTTTLCFVVMPDHLHWLLALEDKLSLAKLIQGFKRYSAFQIRRQARIEGRIWQPGYHDHALRRDEDVKTVARYIVANPLRAGFVEDIGDYPFWDACWL